MQPFAYEKKSRLPVSWVVFGAAAVGFAIWHFDLIPQLQNVETGTVQQPEQDTADELSFPDSWDEIVDHRSGQQDAGRSNATDDPLLMAIAGQQEPVATPVFGESESAPPQPQPEPRSENHAAPLDLTPPEAVTSEGSANAVRDPEVRPASLTTDMADSTRPKPRPVVPQELAQQVHQIKQLIQDDQIMEAHGQLSRIYWKQSEFRWLIQDSIELTAGKLFADGERHFTDPYFVEYGDSLEQIGKQYKLPWQYLARLNHTSPETLQAGQKLKVLHGPFGAVVDLSDFELTIHVHGWYVHRYRIGIGADDRTPVGEFTVQNKLQNPTWYNPDGGIIDADDPDNPLGEYWLGLGNHIGIHGTINPESIGNAVSRGCVHLNDADIAEVFNLLDVGSPVLIRK